MKPVKVMLVGAGGYAQTYVRALLAMNNNAVSFAAVADPFLEKCSFLQQFSEQGVARYELPAQAYAAHCFDLVIISSPIRTHYAYIIEAMEHGCNVLCEKPVVLDMQQIADLQKRQKESGLFVAVGFQQCFDRNLLALKQDVLDGRFGRPLRLKALRFMRRGDAYYRRNAWAGKELVEGQPVFDSPVSNACAHQLQTMLFLLGKSMTQAAAVEKVEGVLYRARPELETYDAAALTITTDKGIPLWYYTGHCIAEKQLGPMGEFEFEKGRVLLEGNSFTALFHDGTVQSYADQDTGMQKLTDAIACIRTNALPVCTVDSVASHAAVVLAARNLGFAPCSSTYTEIEGDGTYVVPGLIESCLRSYADWTIL
ncbi:MAG: Gfo/Idh/MocA family oxidoreductase [Spirochaetia bacterium]|nr:Gfo/Idh/MocA family oxidoreductase [Spirochaetia bacterium]